MKPTLVTVAALMAVVVSPRACSQSATNAPASSPEPTRLAPIVIQGVPLEEPVVPTALFGPSQDVGDYRLHHEAPLSGRPAGRGFRGCGIRP